MLKYVLILNRRQKPTSPTGQFCVYRHARLTCQIVASADAIELLIVTRARSFLMQVYRVDIIIILLTLSAPMCVCIISRAVSLQRTLQRVNRNLLSHMNQMSSEGLSLIILNVLENPPPDQFPFVFNFYAESKTRIGRATRGTRVSHGISCHARGSEFSKSPRIDR